MAGVIYIIENVANGKVYIGKTIRPINRRYNEHFNHLKAGTHYNEHLQKAFKLYKAENFIFDILEVVDDDTCIGNREKWWIDLLSSTDKHYGYNLTLGGDGGETPTLETRLKSSKSHKGREFTDDHKAKISKALKGKNYPNRIKSMTGTNNPSAKLTEEDVKLIKQMLADNVNYKEIASTFNIGRSTVYSIKLNKTWKHVN